MRFRMFVAALGVSLLALTACGGSEDSEGDPSSPAATATADGQSTSAPDPTSTASTAASPTAANATAIVSGEGEAGQLRAAILARDPNIGFDPQCSADNPAGPCATGEWSSEALATGIAAVGITESEGGIMTYWGRTADGTWVYWFASQNVGGPPVLLPGDMIVCANGDGLNLRAEPSTSAAVVALIPDGTVIVGDRLVMTDPPSPGGSFEHPDGWYHITSPQEGWAYDRFLLDYNSAITSCVDTFWP